ncbi:MAG TPA: ABC transporter ATP-binding protein [Casimicrobiaceae bacterium]
MLEAIGITKSFGGVCALSGCSVKVERGQIVGLVGPNGAGKTTLFNILCGLVPPTSGSVTIEDKLIVGLRPDQIAALGAVKTFQVARGFGSLSVIENLLVADRLQKDLSVWRAMMHVVGRYDHQKALARKAFEILEFLRLANLHALPAAHLSTGQRKLLDIGRALMLSPRIILLDEPLAGVNPKLAEQIASRIEDLRKDGMSVALVEHRVEFIRDLCDHVYILSAGSILTEGDPHDVFSQPQVIDIFLGGDVA